MFWVRGIRCLYLADALEQLFNDDCLHRKELNLSVVGRRLGIIHAGNPSPEATCHSNPYTAKETTMSLLQHPSTESPFYSNTATGTGDNKAFSVRNTRPRITQVNESCLEFLLTETVETMFSNALAELPDTKPQDDKVQMASCTTALSSSQREGVYLKLEMLGFRVGYALSERLSRDRPRFTDTLDIVKFVCKDVWTTTFAKQIDNLKTNHRVRIEAMMVTMLTLGRLRSSRQQFSLVYSHVDRSRRSRRSI